MGKDLVQQRGRGNDNHIRSRLLEKGRQIIAYLDASRLRDLEDIAEIAADQPHIAVDRSDQFETGMLRNRARNVDADGSQANLSHTNVWHSLPPALGHRSTSSPV